MPEETQGAGDPQNGAQAQGVTPVITDDVIKNHPLYKAVLEESIGRRLEIDKLKKQIPVVSETLTTPAITPTQVVPDEVQAQLKVLKEQLESLVQTSAQTERQKLVASALAAHKLDADDAAYISGNTVDEINASAAKFAARANKPAAGSSPSSPAHNAETISNSIKDRIAGKNRVHPLDPGVQTNKGGGVLDFSRR